MSIKQPFLLECDRWGTEYSQGVATRQSIMTKMARRGIKRKSFLDHSTPLPPDKLAMVRTRGTNRGNLAQMAERGAAKGSFLGLDPPQATPKVVPVRVPVEARRKRVRVS